MDLKFQPAEAAVESGDLETLKALVAADPTLATTRSSTSHPTLLQCVALQPKGTLNMPEMAAVLVDAGAELNAPLVAAGSMDNRSVAELLLDRGATIDGTGGWSPLEEALYWNSQNVIALFLERGAKIQNLRMAAGLGRPDLIEKFFNDDGTLKPTPREIDWPFGDLKTDRVNGWRRDQQAVVQNAFVYACMHGHIEAAKQLLEKGAEVNEIPGGFDYAGTALHYAALNGHREMVEFLLERGADRSVKDTKVGSTAAGWAEYGGHTELLNLLR
jgi:ankyrin repeat protein